MYSVQRLAREVSAPTEATVKGAKRVLAYLSGTLQLGVEYSVKNEENFNRLYRKFAEAGDRKMSNVVGFSDSDYAGCPVTLKSTTGSILYMFGTPIAWSSRRQSIRATSTCESEYCGIYETLKLCQSQGYLDWFLETEGEKLPLVFTDSQSALALARQAFVSRRSKHIALRMHMVKDHVQDLCYVNTQVNKADPLTKPLVSDKYISLFLTPSGESQDVSVKCCYCTGI